MSEHNVDENTHYIELDKDSPQSENQVPNRSDKYKKCLNLFLLFTTITTLVLYFMKDHAYQQVSNELTIKTKQNKDLSDKNQQMDTYINEMNRYYNIFTEQDSFDTNLTQTNLLNQILYPYHSDIISTIEELKQIREWVGKASIHLMYKSSLHGDNLTELYQRVKGKSNLIIMVKSKNGHRFGGYTSSNFEPFKYHGYEGDVIKADEKAFVFNLDLNKKYPVREFRYAVISDEKYTIDFGDGDLFIPNGFKEKQSYSEFPKNYGNETETKLELTGGEDEFLIEEMEAYLVFHMPQ